MRMWYIVFTVGGIAAAGMILAPLLTSGRFGSGSSPDADLIGDAIQLVQRDYVRPPDARQLTAAALKGMLRRLDPHSDYLDEREFRREQADIQDRFGGIGIRIWDQRNVPTVMSLIDGTPAARAGVQPGDVIVAVDGQGMHGKAMDEVADVLRGQPGSKVALTLSRGGQPSFSVTLTRSVIPIETVQSKLEQDKVGYVWVEEFGARTPRQVKNAVEALEKTAGGKLEGLVLDLRDDPGGLLTSAVDIAGYFLDGGTIVTIHGRHSNDDKVFEAPNHAGLASGAPMVVLINNASASASEIVAGALRDRHRATVMGTRSFGKGTVQTILPLTGHGALRLTTALYYTPSGYSIQGRGISPDIVLGVPKDEQLANVVVAHESELTGAFKNPGPLKPVDGAIAGSRAQTVQPAGAHEDEVPINPQLIGTDGDAQLQAAVAYLNRASAETRKQAGASRRSG